MLWFKHRSDARNSLKLRKVRRKYGADGYAIYWFCLEAIAYDVDKDNLTFELKEDAETIGFELTIQESRVMEIMEYMVKVGLFESSANMITCMKLAESMDKSMTNSPKMRKWLEGKKLPVSESVMTHADDAKTCAELEVDIEVEVDKKKDKSALQEESLEQGFEIFYSAGLVKKSKAQAYKKFKSLAKQMKADPLEFGQLLARDVQTRIAKQQFGIDKLHPSTYLNNQRWTDEHEETNNGRAAQPCRQSAAERINARNDAKYGHTGSGLGVGESGGDLRGAMGEGERRVPITYVEPCAEQVGSIDCQEWNQTDY